MVTEREAKREDGRVQGAAGSFRLCRLSPNGLYDCCQLRAYRERASTLKGLDMWFPLTFNKLMFEQFYTEQTDTERRKISRA